MLCQTIEWERMTSMKKYVLLLTGTALAIAAVLGIASLTKTKPITEHFYSAVRL